MHLCAPPADFAFVRSFFFVSVRPDLNSAPFSLYQQVVTWYNGGTFFCSSFFSPSFFFTSKLVEPHQTDSIAHLIAQCYKRQIFSLLSLTDKRRLFDRKSVFHGLNLDLIL